MPFVFRENAFDRALFFNASAVLSFEKCRSESLSIDVQLFLPYFFNPLINSWSSYTVKQFLSYEVRRGDLGGDLVGSILGVLSLLDSSLSTLSFCVMNMSSSSLSLGVNRHSNCFSICSPSLPRSFFQSSLSF